MNIVDLDCRPGFINSLYAVDYLHGGHYADDMPQMFNLRLRVALLKLIFIDHKIVGM